MPASTEERFIADHLAALSEDFPGAFGLTDDCAEIAPLPGHSLIFKTDPIVEGVHFFSDDSPEDLGWKALAVNVSDIAAKGARPVAYLMALTVPDMPKADWLAAFTAGLRAAQDAFGCILIGGDTDRRQGPLSIAITVIGEVRTGRMVPRAGAREGDCVYVTGELGGSALGVALRQKGTVPREWPLTGAMQASARQRYLRPQPRLGLRTALQAHARCAMDISDGLFKDLDRMCRLTGVGAVLAWEEIPLSVGVRSIASIERPAAVRLASSGDDYEILACVDPGRAGAFEQAAARANIPVHCIGQVDAAAGVRLHDKSGQQVELGSTGWDHFDR